MPLNIVISHAYSSENNGDAALMGVLIKEVHRKFPTASIKILIFDRISKDQRFDGEYLLPSFMQFAKNSSNIKLAQVIYGLIMMSSTLLSAKLYQGIHVSIPLKNSWKQILNVYIDADLIIPVGGGYLRTNKRLGSVFDLILMVHPFYIAKILHKPTVLYSQSIGPVYRPLESWILKHALRNAVLLTLVREDKSMKFLANLGVNHYIRSVDGGFLLESGSVRKPINLKLPQRKLVLGVTTRQWLDNAGQSKYEEAVAAALDHVIENDNVFVVFIPQVTAALHDDDDRLTNAAIYERMRHKKQAKLLTKPYDYKSIKSVYDQLDFILGTRFHSVIFSLTSYVPALAIEYEYKTSGIMHDLGLDKWVIKIEEVTSALLILKLNELFVDSKNYKKQLKLTLPEYILKAYNAIDHVDDAYQDFVIRSLG
jgi:colanic acid/amylovoran biosynthesis protein